MDLTFERGDRSRPKGHALVYFRDTSAGSGRVLATYVVVPPIKLELSKYMPPMLQGRIPTENMADVTAIPLPPVPEDVDSVEMLERLAEARGDDLVNGGTLDASRIDLLLATAGEVAQSYLRLYQDQAPVIEEPERAGSTELDADTVLYGVLSNRERLGELARLLGMARYAASGRDEQGLHDARLRMEQLAEHLPATYRMERLIESSCRLDKSGDRLSELYLDRCYKLLDEDYRALEAIDLEIHSLEQG